MTWQIVVMGVSGSGKSTVGRLLAQRLGVPFRDADDLHPAENIAKMAAGTPLIDADRVPWLRLVGGWLAEHPDGGVIACSALRRHHRDIIRSAAPDAVFAHLHGAEELLLDRVTGREDHFMPPTLLSSQLATLEPLGADERGREVAISVAPANVVDGIVDWLMLGV